MQNDDLISSYDYTLPEELIAQVPIEKRDQSRLMVVDRQSGTIQHHQFSDIPQFLSADDLLVVNNTRVLPARLKGFRTKTQGKWEGLFLGILPDGNWKVIGQTRGRLLPGETITLVPFSSEAASTCSPVRLTLLDRSEGGEWICAPNVSDNYVQILQEFGTMPLPHYMHRDADLNDRERYQTTYAETPGAVAAPTAGLHFTPEVLEHCSAKGVRVVKVTLHVGLGTFRPVNVENIAEHQMHSEWCELPAKTVSAMQETQARHGRVIAVGTTSVRTLESAANQAGWEPWSGNTDIFIRPPYEFQRVQGLVTNFHLPRSTLFILVSAFAGRELVQQAYEEAIRERYRFYSYGDAMLIL